MFISTLYLLAFELENSATMPPKRCSLLSLIALLLVYTLKIANKNIQSRTLPGFLTIFLHFEFHIKHLVRITAKQQVKLLLYII